MDFISKILAFIIFVLLLIFIPITIVNNFSITDYKKQIEKAITDHKNSKQELDDYKQQSEKTLTDYKQQSENRIDGTDKFYTDILKLNSVLTTKVKSDVNYRTYGGCVSNVKNLDSYKKFPGDDAEDNVSRTFWCKPYYTEQGPGSGDTRKNTFK